MKNKISRYNSANGKLTMNIFNKFFYSNKQLLRFVFAIGSVMPLKLNASLCEGALNELVTQAASVELMQNLEKFRELGAEKNSGSGFLIPNETDLGQFRPQYEKMGQGIYLSVGTERGFMSAAMQGQNSTGLILVDRDPKITIFNYYNRALLALATSRIDYQFLRLQADFEHIQKRLKLASSAVLSSQNQFILTQLDIWQWWKLIHQNSAWLSFMRDPKLNPEGDFKNANYLFEEDLFQAISHLAKTNKIFIFNSRLEDPLLLTLLSQTLENNKSKISVLDVSNAWSTGYIGPESTLKMVQSFNSLLTIDSQLVLTYLSQKKAYDNSSKFNFYFFRMKGQQIEIELPAIMVSLQQMEMSLQKSISSRRPYRDD